MNNFDIASGELLGNKVTPSMRRAGALALRSNAGASEHLIAVRVYEAMRGAFLSEWPDRLKARASGKPYRPALDPSVRARILAKAALGRIAAKARGVHMGRKPKLTAHLQQVARDRLTAGESARSIAKDMGVAHTTISRTAA